MRLDYYQEAAKTTAVFPEEIAPAYLALGICGEAGEVAEKIKKALRKGEPIPREEVVKELGDVLWYVAMMADYLGYELSAVAGKNLAKLADRKVRGVLKGAGDDR